MCRVTCKDIRFPTAKSGMGSDAVHVNPNYTSAYVNITVVDTENPGNYKDLPVGKGHIFTIGMGTELCIECVLLMAEMVEGKRVSDIFNNFGMFWR